VKSTMKTAKIVLADMNAMMQIGMNNF